MNDDKHWTWIETVTRIAAFFGMNPVQTRWKLMQWRESWRHSKDRAQSSVEYARYQHRVCPHCGMLQDRSRKTCANCGKMLTPRFLEILKRAGIGWPHFESVSAVLSFIMIVIYVRMVFYQGVDALLGFDTETLVRFGAHGRWALEIGQPWRTSTAMFLHGNLPHIAFNLFALMQVGPIIEQIFGRGRMLFLYMVTGLIGNLASDLWVSHALAIGASGAIMGLIGIAAGWGHREGTLMGISIRDQMVKWLIYTVFFGLVIHADNAAHLGGFISGALFGFFYRPRNTWEPRSFIYKMETVAGILMAVITVGFVFFGPMPTGL